MIIPVFIPQGGCTEKCTFCDQRVSGGTPVSLKAFVISVDEKLLTKRDSEDVEIAFYGGTFTALSQELQLRYLNMAREYIRAEKVKSIRIATRPDAIDSDWIGFLKDEYQLKTVELGVQNFNSDSLVAMGRSYKVESIYSAVEILKNHKLEVGLHLMIGCPEEQSSEDENTIRHILKLKPDCVRIHPLVVIQGTSIAQDYLEGNFTPIDLNTAVDRAAVMTKIFEQNYIKVIRLGLQPNEILSENVIAGPMHPAFGELVRSRILRDHVEEVIAQSEIRVNSHNIRIEVPERLLSQYKGQNSANLEWLKSRFNLSSIDTVVIKGSDHESQIRICHTHRPS